MQIVYRQFTLNVKAYFLGKNKKSIVKLSSAKFSKRAVNVKISAQWYHITFIDMHWIIAYSAQGRHVEPKLYNSLGLFSRRQLDDVILIFSRKINFDISCKSSPLETKVETICMKCRNLFSGQNKKAISIMLSAESFTQCARR